MGFDRFRAGKIFSEERDIIFAAVNQALAVNTRLEDELLTLQVNEE